MLNTTIDFRRNLLSRMKWNLAQSWQAVLFIPLGIAFLFNRLDSISTKCSNAYVAFFFESRERQRWRKSGTKLSVRRYRYLLSCWTAFICNRSPPSLKL